MKVRSTCRQPAARQSGVTLIELMISMAIGIAVVLIVLTLFQNFSGSSRSGQTSQAMNENAEAAFQIIGQQLKQAGFNPRQPRSATPTQNPLMIGSALAPGMGVFACATGFANSTSADNIQSLTCNSTTTTTITYALAVQFEADRYSPSVSGTTPADCRGFAVPSSSVGLSSPTSTETYFVVENRFFISGNGLSCTGNGGGSASFATPNQPLIENIESMSISFGTTAANATGTSATHIAGFLSADELGPASGAVATGVHTSLLALNPIQRWGLVKVLRVCLVVKADRRTLYEPEGGSGSVYGKYRGCNPSDLINITDGFERRAYVRHFALRNRIELPS